MVFTGAILLANTALISSPTRREVLRANIIKRFVNSGRFCIYIPMINYLEKKGGSKTNDTQNSGKTLLHLRKEARTAIKKMIEIKLTKYTLCLTEQEINGLLANNMVLWEAAIQRGKSFRRRQQIISRQQTFAEKGSGLNED